MQIKHRIKVFALASALSLPSVSNAAITITVEQQDSDVVINYSGSWDTFIPFTTTAASGNYVGGNGLFYALGPGEKDYMSVASMSLTSGTWTDTFTNASSFSGDPFGFNLGGDYFAPLGYTAGQSLSGSMTFDNTDLATMGFTPGDSGVFSGAGNTVTFSVSAVPEPSSSLLGLAGLIFGSAFWRRR